MFFNQNKSIVLKVLVVILVLYIFYNIATGQTDGFQNFRGYKYYFNNIIGGTARTPIHTPEDRRQGIYGKDYHWCYGANNYSRSRLGKVSHNYEPACKHVKDIKYYD